MCAIHLLQGNVILRLSFTQVLAVCRRKNKVSAVCACMTCVRLCVACRHTHSLSWSLRARPWGWSGACAHADATHAPWLAQERARGDAIASYVTQKPPLFDEYALCAKLPSVNVLVVRASAPCGSSERDQKRNVLAQPAIDEVVRSRHMTPCNRDPDLIWHSYFPALLLCTLATPPESTTAPAFAHTRDTSARHCFIGSLSAYVGHITKQVAEPVGSSRKNIAVQTLLLSSYCGVLLCS